MDNLLYRFDQATDLEIDPNQGSNTTTSTTTNNSVVSSANKFNILYKNSDKLMKKQQQRRNEILSNRLSKRDKLIDSIRRLVSDVACEDDDANRDEHIDHDDNDNANHENRMRLTGNKIATHNNSRGLVENTNRFENDDSDQDQNFAVDTSSSCTSPNNTNNTTPNKLSGCDSKQQQALVEDKKFRNKAMLSEWLVDRPMDFESDWVLKATPVGRRCLVFARKGETVAYSRTGQFIKAFQSSLPGGCHMNQSHCRRQFAIVDCIYVQNINSFYLMDALAWNEHKLYESEASFRFFWLQSRHNEHLEKFQTINSRNESRFYCLNTYSASDQDILTALNNDPIIKEHNLQLDGLLFFHIRGPYVPGANPLVLWIKPEMANKVLNISATPSTTMVT